METHMRYFTAALAATFIAVVTPNAAFAQSAYTYTFSVPTTLNNLAPTTNFFPTCAVYASANGSGSALNQIEAFQKSSPTGTYTGTFIVVVPSPTKASSYRCWMNVSNAQNTLIASGVSTVLPKWAGTMVTTGAIP
jgi:hypothetical protein